MGQVITVVEKPSLDKGVVRFETNRTLTGMGHEHYARTKPITGQRPPDVLASRIFEASDQAQGIHIFSNIITIELAPHASSDGLTELIRNLYTHYTPGVTPSLP